MNGSVSLGIKAGAVGLAALNGTTSLDMVLRGRSASAVPARAVPASAVPARVVAALFRRAGGKVPGRGTTRDNRREALGALSGILPGLVVATAVSFARRHGVRLSPAGWVLIAGAASMTAGDLPVAALGVSGPRTWTAQDWTLDAAGHLAFGIGIESVLAHQDRQRGPADLPPRQRLSVRLLCRSALLGAATGCRASLSFADPVLSRRLAHGPGAKAPGKEAPGRFAAAAAVVALGGELVVDNLPATPSRLGGLSMAARIAGSGVGAVAHQRGHAARSSPPRVRH